ncbi:MAG: hypothetical protein V3T86_17740 [Planctomycetota bacterium]
MAETIWKYIAITSVAALGIVLLVGQAAPAQKVLELRELRLVDEEGRVRARLWTGLGATKFELTAPQGNNLFYLSVGKNQCSMKLGPLGGGLKVSTIGENARLQLQGAGGFVNLDADEDSKLTVQSNKMRVAISTSKEGGGVGAMRSDFAVGPGELERALLYVWAKERTASIELQDKEGKTTWAQGLPGREK